jgi:hypothetical protein
MKADAKPTKPEPVAAGGLWWYVGTERVHCWVTVLSVAKQWARCLDHESGEEFGCWTLFLREEP